MVAQNELPVGRVITDPGEIYDLAAQFFTELFKAEELEKQELPVLHGDLLQLSLEDREILGSVSHSAEFMEANVSDGTWTCSGH